MPAPAEPQSQLLLIGGAEDKVGRSAVLRRFVRLAGGREARIVVVPTASSVEPAMVAVYDDTFHRLGAAQVESVRPASRDEADDPSMTTALDKATGVFLTGGNQLRLSQLLAGTALGRAIEDAVARGVVVAGTSAGASVMSAHMISLGDEGVTPRHRTSQLSAGLGLLPGVIVDQHFDQRGRYGRLMSLVAASPALLGLGLDEDTAAYVVGGRRMEIIGSGAAFVVDASHATSDAHEARRGAPLMISGAVVHTLPAGAVFDLMDRRLVRYASRHRDTSMQVTHQDRDEARALAGRLARGRS